MINNYSWRFNEGSFWSKDLLSSIDASIPKFFNVAFSFEIYNDRMWAIHQFFLRAVTILALYVQCTLNNHLSVFRFSKNGWPTWSSSSQMKKVNQFNSRLFCSNFKILRADFFTQVIETDDNLKLNYYILKIFAHWSVFKKFLRFVSIIMRIYL